MLPARKAPSNPPSDDSPVVVSFPKSGRTWLRVMLDEMGIAAHYDHDGSDHRKSKPWQEFSSDKSAYGRRRVVFLTRDPRDLVVSGFFQASLRLKTYDGDLAQFVRDPRHGVFKACKFLAQWERAASQLPACLAVTYETMHADTEGVLGEVAAFIVGTPPSSESLARGLAAGRFEVMQEREKSGYYRERYGKSLLPDAVHHDHPEALKTRRGKVGGFVDYLTPDDITYCAQVMRETGHPFGYGLDLLP